MMIDEGGTNWESLVWREGEDDDTGSKDMWGSYNRKIYIGAK